MCMSMFSRIHIFMSPTEYPGRDRSRWGNHHSVEERPGIWDWSLLSSAYS